MFESQTYETLIKRTLKAVKSDVDKREGSIIFDALAPACAELAQMYLELDNILRLTFVQTSFDEFLEKRTSELGINREPATKAKRLVLAFDSNKNPFDVPIGSEFSLENETLNFVVISKIDQGKFMAECTTEGKIGNTLFGRLLPLNTVKGLGMATLSDVLIPGEDVENDETLRNRYIEAVNATPFGGNISDYKIKTRAIEGVGDCKVVPVWNGGGTVKVIISDSEFSPATSTLVEKVQEALDPVPLNQLGLGIAPIGHIVTVTTPKLYVSDIYTKLILKQGIAIGQIEDDIKEILEEYFLELRKEWSSEDVSIRINVLESKILNVNGILDLSETTINGLNTNIGLDNETMASLGQVVLDV